jgi:hypothetical protein
MMVIAMTRRAVMAALSKSDAAGERALATTETGA